MVMAAKKQKTKKAVLVRTNLCRVPFQILLHHIYSQTISGVVSSIQLEEDQQFQTWHLFSDKCRAEQHVSLAAPVLFLVWWLGSVKCIHYFQIRKQTVNA